MSTGWLITKSHHTATTATGGPTAASTAATRTATVPIPAIDPAIEHGRPSPTQTSDCANRSMTAEFTAAQRI